MQRITVEMLFDDTVDVIATAEGYIDVLLKDLGKVQSAYGFGVITEDGETGDRRAEYITLDDENEGWAPFMDLVKERLG